ncbi:thrombopoietin [Pseudophryne corroboree]|uniref:thrombopoietin n=1 Tax=Pseudophryne corroboree TaxID=495146 RepID=UPI003081BFB2
MDINRVYLLLILVLSPDMSWMTSRILCDHRIIQVFVKRTRDLERMAEQCEEPKILMAPITLPNVEVRVAKWKNMTVSQQGIEVYSHLNHFLNVTQNMDTCECVSQQLKRLKGHITEIQGIVKRTWQKAFNNTDLAQEASFIPSDVISTNSSDSKDIFHRFARLLQGKVTFLLQSLREVNCR